MKMQDAEDFDFLNEKLAEIEDPELLDALSDLSAESQLAIYMRFWGNRSISEIARRLQVSWDHADRILTTALLDLRRQIQRPLHDVLKGFAA